VSAKVKVINPVWNGNGRLKRKVAEHYVSEGRAECVGEDLLRLDLSHPQNQAAADRASAWARAQEKAEALGPVNAIFSRPPKPTQWRRIAGVEKCVFWHEPKLIHRPGSPRPLLQYEGKRFFGDGEERITQIFSGKGKHPRAGVRAKFVPEISNAMLADPARDTICETTLDKNGTPHVVALPKPKYNPPSTIGRYGRGLMAFPIGDARQKRKKLDENKYAGR